MRYQFFRGSSSSSFLLIIFLLIINSFFVAHGLKHRAPIFDLQSSSKDKYFGKIKENRTEVEEFSPQIRIVEGTGPICHYVLEKYDASNSNTNDEKSSPLLETLKNGENVDNKWQEEKHKNAVDATVPFDVEILDRNTGRLRFLLKPGYYGNNSLDCSQKSIRFFIRAQRCIDDSLSGSKEVEIQIEDTNNHEPVFDKQWYQVDLAKPLDTVGSTILQLHAQDADCGHPYGEICHYEITGDAEAKKFFHITDSGMLSNKLRLDQVKGPQTFMISVVAHDCGMRRSTKPAVVTVNVVAAASATVADDEATDSAAAKLKSIAKKFGGFPPISMLFNPNDALTSMNNEMCKPQLTNMNERLTYFAGRGALPLFPGAEMKTCSTYLVHPPRCTPEEFEAKISLTSASDNLNTNNNNNNNNNDNNNNKKDYENIHAKTCDRETLSADLQKKICGANEDTVDLLPSSKKLRLENGGDEGAAKKFVEEEKREEEVYVFDGKKNAILVPDPIFDRNLSETFTLHFWMKRDKPEQQLAKSSSSDPLHQHYHYEKENILCLSDNHHMNRHHFAVYAKNCKLEVLFRREKSTSSVNNQNKHGVNKNSADKQEFEPAEWRWHLDQTCDNTWHHYTLNIKFPEVELLVDGSLAVDRFDAPEILDDFPMHHVKNLKNRLVVGACWQGGPGKMAQHFRGYLSAVTLSPYKLEKSSVVQCLLQCKERLEFFGLDKVKAGAEAVFNRDMTELTLKAKNSKDFAETLRKISYLNSRQSPTIGDRIVRVVATVRCAKEGLLPDLLPVVETTISVKLAPKTSRLLLKGSKLILDTSREQVSDKGVQLFPDLKIYPLGAKNDEDSLLSAEDDISEKDQSAQIIDFCKVQSEPPLDKTREFFSSPSNYLLMSDYSSSPSSSSHFTPSSLDFEQARDGLLIKGKAKSKTYEKLLQQIHYFNSRPDDTFPRRVFVLYCSMYEGRLVSDRYIVTLNIDKLAAQHSAIFDNGDADGRQHRVVAKKEPPSTPTPAAVVLRPVNGDDENGVVAAAAAAAAKRESALAADKKIFSSAAAAAFHAGDDDAARAAEVPSVAYAKVQKRLEMRMPEPKLFPSFGGAAGGPFDSFGGPGSSSSSSVQGGPGGAIALIAIVCVAFLLVLAVVGLVKLRGSGVGGNGSSSPSKSGRRKSGGGSKRSRRLAAAAAQALAMRNGGGVVVGGEAAAADAKNGAGLPLKSVTDLAWDDSGMTITINPIDNATPVERRTSVESDEDGQHGGVYSDMSSDGDSFRDDDCLSDEDCDDDDDYESHDHHESGVRHHRHGQVKGHRGGGDGEYYEEDEEDDDEEVDEEGEEEEEEEDEETHSSSNDDDQVLPHLESNRVTVNGKGANGVVLGAAAGCLEWDDELTTSSATATTTRPMGGGGGDVVAAAKATMTPSSSFRV